MQCTLFWSHSISWSFCLCVSQDSTLSNWNCSISFAPKSELPYDVIELHAVLETGGTSMAISLILAKFKHFWKHLISNSASQLALSFFIKDFYHVNFRSLDNTFSSLLVLSAASPLTSGYLLHHWSNNGCQINSLRLLSSIAVLTPLSVFTNFSPNLED